MLLSMVLTDCPGVETDSASFECHSGVKKCSVDLRSPERVLSGIGFGDEKKELKSDGLVTSAS